MSNEIDEIIKGDVDLYDLLDLQPDATESQIKKNYRRKALIYHPDKNPSADASHKFHLISKTYEILTSVNLKSQYDNLRNQKRNQSIKDEELSKERKKFKQDLEKAEREHKLASDIRYQSMSQDFINKNLREKKIDKLKEEGLSLRRARESQHLSQIKSPVDEDTTVLGTTSYTLRLHRTDSFMSYPNTVKIKWKSKANLKDLFTEDILIGIMSIFGRVSNCKMLESSTDLKYDYGVLSYHHHSSVLKAIKHDYNKSAKLWDGTNYRKLSSLLREVTLLNEPTKQTEQGAISGEWYDDDWYKKCKYHFKPFLNDEKYDISKVDLGSFQESVSEKQGDVIESSLNKLKYEEIRRIKRRKA